MGIIVELISECLDSRKLQLVNVIALIIKLSGSGASN